jgi:hypothetical protein
MFYSVVFERTTRSAPAKHKPVLGATLLFAGLSRHLEAGGSGSCSLSGLQFLIIAATSPTID